MKARYRSAAIVLGGFLLFGCGEKIEPGHTPTGKGPKVSAPVITVQRTSQPLLYDAVGTVRARASAVVSGKLMGTIKMFKVREGDSVRKGDVLVILDARQVSAQLNQAEAALAEAKQAESGAVYARQSAEAGAEQSQLTYRRQKSMLEGGAITQEAFEAFEAQFKQAQAAVSRAKAMVEAAQQRVRQAKAMVDAARVAQNDARVLAPYDGKVIAKLAETGDLSSPGAPLLTLEKIGGHRVDLMVPETHIRHVTQGQSVEVRVPAASDSSIAGTVEVVVPSADQGSRSFVVQVNLGGDPALRTGMFARVALAIGSEPALLVPQTAVVHQGQLTGVYIVDPDATARFRLVRIGAEYGDQVKVISGLRDGARVVAVPGAKLKNGSVVESTT